MSKKVNSLVVLLHLHVGHFSRTYFLRKSGLFLLMSIRSLFGFYNVGSAAETHVIRVKIHMNQILQKRLYNVLLENSPLTSTISSW